MKIPISPSGRENQPRRRGVRVKVVADDLAQVVEIHGGRGNPSHYGTRLHFGLGRRNRVDRIAVRWIGGGVDVWENLGVDCLRAITKSRR